MRKNKCKIPLERIHTNKIIVNRKRNKRSIYSEIQARRKPKQFSSITFKIRKFIQYLDQTKEIFENKSKIHFTV